jgi:hypothetical protein
MEISGKQPKLEHEIENLALRRAISYGNFGSSLYQTPEGSSLSDLFSRLNTGRNDHC